MADQERCSANFIAGMCLIIRGKCSKGVLEIIGGLLLSLTDCPFKGPRQRQSQGLQKILDECACKAVYWHGLTRQPITGSMARTGNLHLFKGP